MSMMDFGYDEEGHSKSLGDLHLWKRIIQLGSHHFLHSAGAIVLSLLITAATLGLPWLLQHGIDIYITDAHQQASVRLAGISDICLIYGLLVVAVFLLTFLQVLLLEYIGQTVMHRIRQDLFAHLLGLDLPFFNEHPTGRLVTRLTNDIQNMHEMFTSVMVTLFNDFLRMAGILVVLVVMNPRLGLWMVLFVPLATVMTLLFARIARVQFRAIRSQLSAINSYLSEAISGISILQLFGRQASASQHYEELSDSYLTKSLSQIKVFGLFMPVTEFMSSLATALILWYGGGEILQSRLSLGELVAFISYMRLFFQPLRELSQNYSIVQSAMASAERIFQFMDTKSHLPAPAHPKQLPAGDGSLLFDDITFGYGDEPVIHNLSLQLQPQKTTALVGSTGSGKTTLINLLLRFYDPGQGRILLDGAPIAELDLTTLRSAVGVILQDVLILQDSLLANIVMDTGVSRQKVEEILVDTGMDRFVSRLPAGLDTLIGEGGQELSSGEKQMLSFARVLCRNPRILVLDEATAAIDTESENILEEALQRAFVGRTSLIIAHRLSTIKRADHIVVMAHGRIIEQGSHTDLMQRMGQYASMVEMDRKPTP